MGFLLITRVTDRQCVLMEGFQGRGLRSVRRQLSRLCLMSILVARCVAGRIGSVSNEFLLIDQWLVRRVNDGLLVRRSTLDLGVHQRLKGDGSVLKQSSRRFAYQGHPIKVVNFDALLGCPRFSVSPNRRRRFDRRNTLLDRLCGVPFT